MFGALAMADIQFRHRGPVLLDQRKGLACIDGLQLGAVTNHHQTVETQAIGDGYKIIHRLVRHQRRLVEHQHGVLEGGLRRRESLALPGERSAQMLVHEGGNRLGLNPGVTLQHLDHGVGLRQPKDLTPFAFGGFGHRGNQRGLAGPRNAWITTTRSLLDSARMPASSCSPLKGARRNAPATAWRHRPPPAPDQQLLDRHRCPQGGGAPLRYALVS
jgi:hypothetical protein